MNLLQTIRQTFADFPAVRLAVLFGSTARGRDTAGSDVDLAVYLEEYDPAGLWPIDVAVAGALRRTIDLVDLRRAPPLLRFEIARDGILVIEREEGAWTEFRFARCSTGGISRPWRAASTSLPPSGSGRRRAVVKHDVVARKVGLARRRLAAADEVFSRPLEAYLADEPGRDLACFYLFLAIQECFDLATHWVADDDLGTPDELGEVFDILADHGVIDRDLAERLRGATGLRNRISHGYGLLDPERIRAEYPAGSASLRDFLTVAAEAVGL